MLKERIKRFKNRPKPVRSSDILLNLAEDKTLGTDLTFKLLVTILGRRSFGVALLLFSLPSALPFSIIPGFSTVFSIPILVFGIQMLFGMKTLGLPSFIADRKISHENLAKIIKKFIPYLKAMERFLKPRLAFMTNAIGESITGLLIAGLAITLMLPIPLTNFFISLALILLALGTIEKDGLFIIFGWLATIIILTFIPTFIVAVVKKIWIWFTHN